jgi:hypothetical protein
MMTCFTFLSFIHPRVLSLSLSLYMNTELFSFTYKTKEANKHFTVWFTIPDWLAILMWKQRFFFRKIFQKIDAFNKAQINQHVKYTTLHVHSYGTSDLTRV